MRGAGGMLRKPDEIELYNLEEKDTTGSGLTEKEWRVLKEVIV